MPKILPKAQQLEARWLEELYALDAEVELFLAASGKKDQTAKIKAFRELLAKLDRYDPILAASVLVKPAHRDRRHWVSLIRTTDDPLVGYTKEKDGTITQVGVKVDPERSRIVALMIGDGFSLDEMNAALPYPLTQEEKAKWRKKK